MLCASAFYEGIRLEDDYNEAKQNPPQPKLRGEVIHSLQCSYVLQL